MGKRKYEADEAAEKEYKENMGKLATERLSEVQPVLL